MVDPTGQCSQNWYYFPRSNTWCLLNPSNLPSARRASDSAAAVGGVIYEFGGVWLGVGGASITLFRDLHAFDTTSERWMQMFPNYNRGPAPPPTFGHSATRVGRWIVIFGGRTTSPTQPGSSQTWKYTAISPIAS